MTSEQAEQIATLLNSRNRLQNVYTAPRVLEHRDDYLFELRDGAVIACVEVKKVQWYQSEICHLSVSQTHENQGFGKRQIRLAEEKLPTMARESSSAQSASEMRTVSGPFVGAATVKRAVS